MGLLLGSGFAGLAKRLEAHARTPFVAIPGWPARAEDEDGGWVAAADVAGVRTWIFSSRLHMYEGHSALAAAYPVDLLAAGGADTVVLTCAAGGLRDEDRPGDFAIVTDHVNLLGDDPIRHIPSQERKPAFVDLQQLYDARLAEAWRAAARESEVSLRDGVLAAMHGPCYETPAEVRMLRAMGADLASMSVVPEAILARYRGLRVAAVCCISNRGSGLTRGQGIAHDGVVDVVQEAVRRCASFIDAGLCAMVR